MNATWSKRIAKIVNTEYFSSLPVLKQLSFREKAQSVDGLGELSQEYKDIVSKSKVGPAVHFHTILLQGGEGSGNFGHAGIPGQVGGSSKSGGEIDPYGQAKEALAGWNKSTIIIAGEECSYYSNPDFKSDGGKYDLFHDMGKENLSSVLKEGLDADKSRRGGLWFVDKGMMKKFDSNPGTGTDLGIHVRIDKSNYDIQKSEQGVEVYNNIPSSSIKGVILYDGSRSPTTQKEVHFHIIPVVYGGSGSGNFGHAGTPGRLGGSGPGGSSQEEMIKSLAQKTQEKFGIEVEYGVSASVKDEPGIVGKVAIIDQEVNRLFTEFPEIAEMYKEMEAPLSVNLDKLDKGTYGVCYNGIGFRVDPTQTTATEEGRWNTGGYHGGGYGGDRPISYVFRHEFAHDIEGLGYKASDWELSGPRMDRLMGLQDRIDRSYDKTKDISGKGTRYAASNSSEMFAESFAIYTSPRYGSAGRLPSSIEKTVTGLIDPSGKKVITHSEVHLHIIRTMGGQGSGNFGHSGIPGQVGGSGGGGNTTVPESLKKELLAGTEADSREHAVIIDSAGKISTQISGSEGSTDFGFHTDLDKAGADLHIVHTHPLNETLSNRDIEVLQNKGVGSVSAILPNGSVHTATAMTQDRQEIYRRTNELFLKSKTEIIDKQIEGKISTKKEYDALLVKAQETNLRQLDKENLIRYTVTSSPTTQKEINFHIITTQQSSLQDNFNPNHDDWGGFASGSGGGGTTTDQQKFDSAQNFNKDFSKREDLDAQVTNEEVHNVFADKVVSSIHGNVLEKGKAIGEFGFDLKVEGGKLSAVMQHLYKNEHVESTKGLMSKMLNDYLTGIKLLGVEKVVVVGATKFWDKITPKHPEFNWVGTQGTKP